MFVILLPILQAIAACCTIFGFVNTPRVADTVVTYGISADEAPNAAMWMNSVGSIALGVGTWIVTLIMKKKIGYDNPLYKAALSLIHKPNDKLTVWTCYIESVDAFYLKFGDPATDTEAIAYIKKYATDKFVADACKPPATPVS